jgi:hypothetical protein
VNTFRVTDDDAENLNLKTPLEARTGTRAGRRFNYKVQQSVV